MFAAKRSGITAIAIALAAIVPGPAFSQNGVASVPMTMAPIYMNTTIGLIGIDAARRSTERTYGTGSQSTTRAPGRSGPQVRAAPTGPASFTVGDDPSISRQVANQFASLVRHSNDPQHAASIIATYQRKPVRTAFREAAGPFGLSDHDLRDVAAAYTIVGWMVANQAPIPSQAQVRGVRQQLGRLMATRPPSSSAAKRQTDAEQMMYELTAMLYARGEGERTHNNAGLAAMATTTAAAFRKKGMDFRHIALTNQGFADQ